MQVAHWPGVILNAKSTFPVVEVLNFDSHFTEFLLFERWIDFEVKVSNAVVRKIDTAASRVADARRLCESVLFMVKMLQPVVVFMFDFAENHANGVGF